jgi:hypothetical protein
MEDAKNKFNSASSDLAFIKAYFDSGNALYGSKIHGKVIVAEAAFAKAKAELVLMKLNVKVKLI